ncbi:MAG TPA: arsenic transporter, partial [Patescibacteria group bacterium]|nr:arsenic transporter [Patescibacteria group bacterium]
MFPALVSPKIITLIIFILTYCGLIFLPKKRLLYAGVGAGLLIILQIINLPEIITAIDWNVLLMILGTSGLVIF